MGPTNSVNVSSSLYWHLLVCLRRRNRTCPC